MGARSTTVDATRQPVRWGARAGLCQGERMTTTTCQVHGCDLEATETITFNETMVMQARVCSMHALDFNAGGAWEYDGKTHEFVMGDDLPLEIVDYSRRMTLGGESITLVLGRGPEKQQVVSFRLPEGFLFGDPDDDPFIALPK